MSDSVEMGCEHVLDFRRRRRLSGGRAGDQAAGGQRRHAEQREWLTKFHVVNSSPTSLYLHISHKGIAGEKHARSPE
jgi:hypothetical protein